MAFLLFLVSWLEGKRRLYKSSSSESLLKFRFFWSIKYNICLQIQYHIPQFLEFLQCEPIWHVKFHLHFICPGLETQTKYQFLLLIPFLSSHMASSLFQIFVKDVWKEYTGWPLNDMERSYKFMVRHVQLWKVAFHSTSPRWIHSVYLAAIAAYYAKYLCRCYANNIFSPLV